LGKLFFFLFFSLTVYAKTFTIATYNVENLFDLTHDKTEYNEFIPNKTNWNQEILSIKLNNIAYVINDLNADIIALQEIESQKALELLLEKLPQYPYYDFVKNPSSSVGVAVMSKYKIIKRTSIAIASQDNIERPIQAVRIEIEKNKEITIFNNHWRSKRSSESKRLNYAMSLQKHLETLPKNSDYILVGDFNSNYDEYLTFKHDQTLNDSYGITGINQILNTVFDEKFITKENILNQKQTVHYNLWLDLPYQERFSSIYRNNHITPDNIIVSKALFNDKNISYIHNSFHNFTPKYLIQNNKIKRWEMKDEKHKGEGYSDHLPIIASFTTSNYDEPKPILKAQTISEIYALENLTEPLTLNNLIVVYKENNNAILKQKDDRAIYAYNCASDLKLGYAYDITIKQLHNHFGLKEIISLQIHKEHSKTPNVKEYFLEAKQINLFDVAYQNEIITNLTGTFKNGYIHFGSNEKDKIKLYAKDKLLLPKNGEKVTIMSGHLGFYKSNVQIIIYSKSDIRVN
jgi:exonuclease III